MIADGKLEAHVDIEKDMSAIFNNLAITLILSRVDSFGDYDISGFNLK